MNIVRLLAGRRTPPLVLAQRLGLGDTFTLSFLHHFPLELSHRTQDVQHELASSIRCIQP